VPSRGFAVCRVGRIELHPNMPHRKPPAEPELICLHGCLKMHAGVAGGRMDHFLELAIEEARQGLAEGGIPIGSVLVIEGRVVGRGHNRRVQRGSAILHAEMDCLENAGRLSPADYRRAVLYSTLSPCDMCSGTALLYRIPKIVIGENRTFQGPEEYVRSRGVDLEIVDDAECYAMMQEFIAAHPELWNEDIGEIAGSGEQGARSGK